MVQAYINTSIAFDFDPFGIPVAVQFLESAIIIMQA